MKYAALVCIAMAVLATAHNGEELPSNDKPILKWGKEGHYISGMVAQQLLSAAAANQVNSILGGQTLQDVSDWADQVKSDPQWAWTKPLHYVNTPDWACTYQTSRDCADSQCVIGAISNFTTQFQSSTGQDQTNFLKFLVHLIGDIHQPLHVGFTSDAGGNKISVSYNGKHENLHSVWDTGMLVDHINNDYGGSTSTYAQWIGQQIAGPWASQAVQWAQCSSFVCPAAWASETVAVACSNAYTDASGNHIQSGDSLGNDYYTMNTPIIDIQLARGGVRLAAALNRLLQ